VQHPEVCVVILSSASDPESVEAARAGGAAAYVVKTIDPGNLAAAIRSAARGEAFAVSGAPQPAEGDGTGLSARETMVLAAIGRGLSNAEVARSLWISDQTVKFHLRNIYKKLGVSNRTEAARHAYPADLDKSAEASG
jgi:DNA-binding NarL/FixJ family response regulator